MFVTHVSLPVSGGVTAYRNFGARREGDSREGLGEGGGIRDEGLDTAMRIGMVTRGAAKGPQVTRKHTGPRPKIRPLVNTVTDLSRSPRSTWLVGHSFIASLHRQQGLWSGTYYH